MTAIRNLFSTRATPIVLMRSVSVARVVRIAVSTPDLQGNVVDAKYHAWQRVAGSTLDDLTLQPSIMRYPGKEPPRDGETEWRQHAGWHGFVTAGQLVTCW